MLRAPAYSAGMAAIESLLAWSPLQPLFRRRCADRLAVLAYHAVTSPEHFARQLDHIRAHGAAVTLEEATDALMGRRRLPANAVLITFDDGDRSIHDVALPLLVERAMPAVAFVVAGLLDTETPFWWDEVRGLIAAGGRADGLEVAIASGQRRAPAIALKKVDDQARLAAIDTLRRTATQPVPSRPQLRTEELRALETAGVAIGNHSLTHPCLARCPQDKIRNEISQAHDLLTAALGHEPTTFAYPDGSHDARVRDAVAAAGYDVAFAFDHALATLPARDPLAVSRLRIDADADLDRLRIITSGLHPAIHRLRGLG